MTYLVEVRNKRGQLAMTAMYKMKSGSEPTGKATPAETDARYNRDTPPLSEDSIGSPFPQVNEKAGPEGMADSAPGAVTGTSSHSFSQPAQMAGAGQVKVKVSEIIQALSDAIGTPLHRPRRPKNGRGDGQAGQAVQEWVAPATAPATAPTTGE